MKMYFCLQCKRVLRLLPLLVCVVLILFFGLSFVFDAIVESDKESSENTRFRVGLVGSAEENYLDMGLAAMETLDDSRFALEIVRVDTEENALNALRNREFAAVVIIPEGFIDDALRGEMPPLQYVTVHGNLGLVPLFKDEITAVISDLLVASQKGVYGTYDVFAENGQKQDAQALMDRMNLEYVELVLLRSRMYSVEELGIADDLDFSAYLFCGISVLLLFLISLPFAVLFVPQDQALGCVLSARRCGALRQTGAEYLAMLGGISVLYLTVLAALTLQGGKNLSSIIDVSYGSLAALRAFPAVLMVSAFGFLIFELTRDLVSGVLLHFFSALSLCYVSGCLYPIYTFPDVVQKLAAVLPTGIARSHLSACITDRPCLESGIWLTGYAVLFFAGAVFVRCCKLRKGRG